MSDFYKQIKKHFEEEAHDNTAYLKLAEMAPTVKAKKILTDIAHEEAIHHKFLKEIMDDMPCEEDSEEDDEDSDEHKSNSEISENKADTKYTANRQIDYPPHIENAGVDPDLIK